jgi:hypothetical protein
VQEWKGRVVVADWSLARAAHKDATPQRVLALKAHITVTATTTRSAPTNGAGSPTATGDDP